MLRLLAGPRSSAPGSNMTGRLPVSPTRSATQSRRIRISRFLDVLGRLGAGFDIVSAGELERVLAAGASASRVVFSGVGKHDAEMAAALEARVGCFNVESACELDRLAALAASAGKRAPVSLRVNPDIDAHTHPYITTGLRESKFGIPIEEAPGLYARAGGGALARGARRGLPHRLATCERHAFSRRPRSGARARRCAGVRGDPPHSSQPRRRARHPLPGRIAAAAADLAGALVERLAGRDLVLVLEPGRSIVGNAGVLLTPGRIPQAQWGEAVRGGGRGDERSAPPGLYDAWHDVVR